MRQRFMLKIFNKSVIMFLCFISFDLMAQGEQIFGTHCARCHSSQEMTDIIHDKWVDRSTHEFFLINKKTMPGESPAH